MRIVSNLDRDLWKKFVDDHPQGNIFHTPEMFEVYKSAKEYHPSLWAVVENERVLALHLPVQITLVGGPSRYLTTRDVDFGGVLVEQSEHGRQALALLLREYNLHMSGAPLFTEFRNFSDQTYVHNILVSQGYKYEDHLNYLVDLRRDKETILGSFTRSTRSNIRKTLREGNIVVDQITDRTMLPQFYNLLTKTYKKARVPLADISLFEATFNILVPRNMAYFAIASVNGTPAASQVSLLYKDVALGWYNGVDRTFRNCNELVMWDVIWWSAKHGFSVFDFGGAGKPEEESGVRKFKAKFKGDLVNYGRHTCIHAPVRMKISETAYQVARSALYPLLDIRNALLASHSR